MAANAHFRYEELASFIVGLIENGTLLAGSRIPSLREISLQRRVSLSTALQAYRTLEDRGVLEARPQSGYYVASAARSLEPPAKSQPPARAASIALADVVARLLEHGADPKLVPLGCAVPSAKLLAAGRLDRFLARVARRKGTSYNTYTVPRGDVRLRREIARRALRWGQALAPDDIVITCGCTEALTIALNVVAERGDTIAVESPTYFGLLHTMEILGLKAFELPTDATHGIDLDALGAALKGKSIKACLLSSGFSNPLGYTMPDERKLAVLRLLARHDVPLIEDDIYGDIHFDKTRPRPFMALDPNADVLYCSSFSKTVAPGYRIGWLANTHRMQRILEKKSAFSLCGPALPQAALADFLNSGGYDHHLRRLRREFHDNIQQMTRSIEKHFPPGTRVSRPAGGFVLWLELAPAVDTRELFEAALEKGICFAPGDVFSASKRYRNCLRLSCGHSWSPAIENALRLLGAMARKMVTT
jgi:DNA-binding transcriptional MocR family regulator